jgi:hypothetical protein
MEDAVVCAQIDILLDNRLIFLRRINGDFLEITAILDGNNMLVFYACTVPRSGADT